VKHGADQHEIDVAAETFYASVPSQFGEYCMRIGSCTKEHLELALSEQAVERGDYEAANRMVYSINDRNHNEIMEYLRKIGSEISSFIAIHPLKR
jgi:hypothetical protein